MSQTLDLIPFFALEAIEEKDGPKKMPMMLNSLDGHVNEISKDDASCSVQTNHGFIKEINKFAFH